MAEGVMRDDDELGLGNMPIELAAPIACPSCGSSLDIEPARAGVADAACPNGHRYFMRIRWEVPGEIVKGFELVPIGQEETPPGGP